MNNFLFVFFIGFVFSQNVFARFENQQLFDYDFFQSIPFSEWVLLDSTKKSFQINNFLDRELVFYDALSLGLQYKSKNFLRLSERHEQLLVNSFYEKVVAEPFINKKYIEKTKKFIKEKVYVHHVLVGFNGCSLSGSFTKTKKEAFLFADSLKTSFNKECAFCSVDEKRKLFSSLASSHSQDPSVSQNKGEIGWVSWGQVMDSFQTTAFNSPVFVISDPVLTEYGYHLILVEKRGFSDFNYYNPSLLNPFCYKFGLQRAPVDSLRSAAALFDSLYIEEGGFETNPVVLNEIFLEIDKKTRVEKLRGGKNTYIEWLEKMYNKKVVLFVFKNKGFGVGWFVNQLKKSPATRIPTLRKKEHLVELIRSFLLKEGALLGAYEKNLHEDVLFKKEVLEQNKNILYRSYTDWAVSSLPPVDSLLVSSLYEKGMFKGEYIKPKGAVFTEIKINNEKIIQKIYKDFLSGVSFDDLVVAYGGSLKKPVYETGNSPLVETLFLLSPGDVSKPLLNSDKSFSLVRLEEFLDSVPFELKNVYSQIEQKIKKEQKDSLKKNLSGGLKEKFNLVVFREVLSF